MAGESEKQYSYFGNFFGSFSNSEHKSTKWPRTSTPRFPTKRNDNLCPHKFLHAEVHSSVLHNSPKLEIIQMTLH